MQQRFFELERGNSHCVDVQEKWNKVAGNSRNASKQKVHEASKDAGRGSATSSNPLLCCMQ